MSSAWMHNEPWAHCRVDRLARCPKCGAESQIFFAFGLDYHHQIYSLVWYHEDESWGRRYVGSQKSCVLFARGPAWWWNQVVEPTFLRK